jgi:hypothetical protein
MEGIFISRQGFVRLYKVDLIRCLLLCFALLAFGAQFIVTEMIFFPCGVWKIAFALVLCNIASVVYCRVIHRARDGLFVVPSVVFVDHFCYEQI